MKNNIQENLNKLEEAIAQKRAQVENLEKEAVQLENIRNCHKEIEEFIATTCTKYSIALNELANIGSLAALNPDKTEAQRKKYTVPLRYRNPETAQTWSGSGRPPFWFKINDANRYLIEGQQHSSAIKTKIEELIAKEKQEKGLTKEHAAKLKTLALGWQKIFDRGIQKTVKNQWIAEINKNTPHLHYVETFLSRELISKLHEWEENI